MTRLTTCAFLLSIGVLMGCNPKNYKYSVIPKQEGTMVTTNAASETDALEGAKREAEELCAKTQQQYVVIDGPTSSYVGPDQNVSVAAGLASSLLKGKGSRDEMEDYRAQMMFKCQ